VVNLESAQRIREFGLGERYPEQTNTIPREPRITCSFGPSLYCLVAFSRDRKPQEEEPEENKQGLKDEVHLCIRKMMEAKIQWTQTISKLNTKRCPRHAPKERGRGARLLKAETQ